MQAVLATTRGGGHEVVPPEFAWQRLANEFGTLGLGALIKVQVVVVCDLGGMAHHCGHGKQVAIAELP